MSLNVAVQMDPIERINIRGDSTSRCCWRRSPAAIASRYYTPDRLALRDGRVFAAVQPLRCATSWATISPSASRGAPT